MQKQKSTQSGQAKPAFSNKFAAFGGEDEWRLQLKSLTVKVCLEIGVFNKFIFMLYY